MKILQFCEANTLFGNHLLICSDQYFYENLNLPQMALEAEPPLNHRTLVIPVAWEPKIGLLMGSSWPEPPGEVQSIPSSGCFSW